MLPSKDPKNRHTYIVKCNGKGVCLNILNLPQLEYAYIRFLITTKMSNSSYFVSLQHTKLKSFSHVPSDGDSYNILL